MNKITLILGGARSGKSSYALELAKKYKKVAFLATCQALDREMDDRIKRHKQARPSGWKTFEEPHEIIGCLQKIDKSFECIVVDCLTLLVSNLMLKKYGEGNIEGKMEEFFCWLKKHNRQAIIVSNEVGLGVVPVTKLGRDFRDIAGKVNQIASTRSDEVFFMVSGIPMRIKKGTQT